ncbi:MAG: GNAT family N-acetyltransferase [Pirellulales bacterium]
MTPDDRYRIVTPRLRLREFTWNDLDFYAELLGDPEVMRWYPKVLTRDEAAEHLTTRILPRYAEHGDGLWLVEDRATGAPLGRVGVIRQNLDDGQHVEVGYMIHRPYWRRGYATEAARACHAYVFDTLQADHVIALVRPENEPSQRTAQALGLTIARQTMHFGLLHDVYRKERDAGPV